MIRKRKKRPSSVNSQSWMVTFSDLVTLILVFFILLFSMSNIDNMKFKALTDSMKNQQILDFSQSNVPLDYSENMSLIEERKDSQEYEKYSASTAAEETLSSQDNLTGDLDEILSKVQKQLVDHNLEDVIVANRDARGVVLVLQEQVLFKTGEAEIVQEAAPFLNTIGQMLAEIPNYIKVEGHTDNRPITTYRYPSNWELSTARASSIIRYFTSQHGVNASRFIATGYGDTKPLVPNTTEENLEKNRRVEIIISDPAAGNE